LTFRHKNALKRRKGQFDLLSQSRYCRSAGREPSHKALTKENLKLGDERVLLIMSIKSGNTEKFKQFSQFSSLQEFNQHMEMWSLEHKRDFTKGELVGLKRLVRFAAKVPGVCNAKIGTILKSIHAQYNDNGISRSTFKRMILKAKEFGIITVFETERKNGSQSSNLYQFNRFPTNELPKEEKMNHQYETSNLIKTNNQKINKRYEEPSTLDYSYVNSMVPQPFVQLVKCFFSDAKTIEEYWQMVQITAFRFECTNDTEDILDISIQAFRQLIRKIKRTNLVKNPIAYFYGILNNKFMTFYLEKISAMGTTTPITYTFIDGINPDWDWLQPNE
jgi:N-acetylglutamate synthase-like GNAT family acetyltransferase